MITMSILNINTKIHHFMRTFHILNTFKTYQYIHLKKTFMCLRSIAWVPLSQAAPAYLITMWLHTTSVRSSCTWSASCVVALNQKKNCRQSAVFAGKNGGETFRITKCNLHVSNSICWELGYEFKIESIWAQEHGVPEIGQSKNRVVSKQHNLTGKMAKFGGFLRNAPQKNPKLCWSRLLNTFARPSSHKSCSFSTRIFSKNIQDVTVWLSNRCFGGPKWRGNIYFEKVLFADTIFNFSRPSHSLIEPIRPQEEVFPKIGSSEFSVTFYTIMLSSESALNYKYFEK